MRRLRLIYLVFIFGFCGVYSGVAIGQVIVRMDTNRGTIDIELYDTAAPVTVTNFLNYANSGRYDGTIIHRSIPGFIIQGGGYSLVTSSITPIATDPAIVNEYDPSRSNIRGTIAMAKLPSGPDTATSEWFFNLADNSANLDNQNGGFTVFGQVINNGMDIVDVIAGLNTVDCSGPFTDLPVLPGVTTCPVGQFQSLVTIKSVREIPYIQDDKAVVIDYAGNIVSLFSFLANFSSVTVSDNPSPVDAPNSVDFSEGFFSMQAGDLPLDSNGMYTILMVLPDGYFPNTYYMYGPTSDNISPHWYEFNFDGRTGAEFNGSTIGFHFIDGERGDSDLSVNGQISNFGAPGISANALTYNRVDTGSLGWSWLLLLAMPLFGRFMYCGAQSKNFSLIADCS